MNMSVIMLQEITNRYYLEYYGKERSENFHNDTLIVDKIGLIFRMSGELLEPL